MILFIGKFRSYIEQIYREHKFDDGGLKVAVMRAPRNKLSRDGDANEYTLAKI